MKTKNLSLCILLLALLLSFGCLSSRAQAESFSLVSDKLQNGKTVALDKAGWKYQSGDNAEWAQPAFDDSRWNTLNGATTQLEKLATGEWKGIGWFRLRIRTDELLRGKVIGMGVWQTLGATEIYLNGELVRRFGEISASPAETRFANDYGTPFIVKLADSDEHLIAVRFRSVIENSDTFFSRWVYTGTAGNGFYLAFADINEAIVRREQTQRSSVSATISRVVIYLVVGLLHLLLFWFYPPQRANFYFGIYALLTAVSTFISYVQYESGTADLVTYTFYRISSRILFLSYSLAFLLFLYRAFLPRSPRLFPVAAILWAVTNIAALFFSDSTIANVLFGAMTVVFVGECLRVMVIAIRQRSEGAWIVALGVLTALIGPLRYLYLAVGLMIPKETEFYLGFISSYGMLAAVSIYLARNFARTNIDLAAQLANVRELSARTLEHERVEAELRLKHEHQRAENERRAKELEEARQLQLSMLPARVPQFPNMEIAAYMKPATEVGGDYYDFHIKEDGTLTIAIGDATGHGLKAGTVVTATKGLFNNLAPAPDIPDTLSQISRSLKAMNLRGLFMAMTILKIKDNRVSLSSAGMPSILIYRNKTKTVEQISFKALPLGSLTKYKYRQQEILISPGDTIVLMSDGFPEMFNEQNELLGYDKAESILLENSHLSPQELINRFVETAGQWAGARPQDDDVTFVVLKVKGTNLN